MLRPVRAWPTECNAARPSGQRSSRAASNAPSWFRDPEYAALTLRLRNASDREHALAVAGELAERSRLAPVDHHDAAVEAYDISDERIDLGSRVTLPKSWHARVSGEQDVPGTITVRVEWDAALGRTAVVFAALEREGEGVDITSQMLREVRTHWIMTRSALEVVTVDVGGEGVGDRDRIPVTEFLSRVLAKEEREPLESLYAAIAVYRVATAISYPPLKLVSDTLKIIQSTATAS